MVVQMRDDNYSYYVALFLSRPSISPVLVLSVQLLLTFSLVRNLYHISGYFPNLDAPRGVRGPNLVRSTRLVELPSSVSPETLTEPTEACQLRPKRPFNELINRVSRQALLVFLNGPISVSRYSSQVRH